MNTDGRKKRCFVVMGFGQKTDLATGRVLDLDKTYRHIIKYAVLDVGLECIRADEVMHSGIIDKPMYELLLEADVVVADLSTSNANAIYQLGIRHALRPHGTIIIAEKQFRFPFDIGNLIVHPYEHLGVGIDAEEVVRVRDELKRAIKELLEKQEVDSPVYAFLPHLHPPSFERSVAGPRPAAPVSRPAEGARAEATSDVTLADLLERAESALKAKDFTAALSLFEAASDISPNNPTITQRRVLTIYKSKMPDAVSALSEARRLLESLSPKVSADPVTVGLLGDIELSLFEAGQGSHHLINARQAFERLYTNRPDWHRGLMFAYVVARGAARQLDPEERNADLVIARRRWREVVELSKNRLAEINALRQVGKYTPEALDPTERAQEETRILAAMAEAHYGLGEFEKYQDTRTQVAWARDGGETLKFLDSRTSALSNLARKDAAPAAESGGAGNAPEAGAPNQGAAASGRGGATTPREDGLVFFSYAHNERDTQLLDEIQKTLAPSFRKSNVRLWDDRQIKAGQKWRDAIEDALSRARAGVLLVSRDFLNSEFIAEKELPSLLKGAEKEGVKMLWVAVEKSLVGDTEIIDYQALNDPKNPLSRLDEEAYGDEIVSICEKIRNSVLPEKK